MYSLQALRVSVTFLYNLIVRIIVATGVELYMTYWSILQWLTEEEPCKEITDIVFINKENRVEARAPVILDHPDFEKNTYDSLGAHIQEYIEIFGLADTVSRIEIHYAYKEKEYISVYEYPSHIQFPDPSETQTVDYVVFATLSTNTKTSENNSRTNITPIMNKYMGPDKNFHGRAFKLHWLFPNLSEVDSQHHVVTYLSLLGKNGSVPLTHTLSL
jgi:hypothetical protein